MTLPDGWKLEKWESVLQIKSGRSQKQVINPNGKYPIYGSGGIMGYADDYICDEGTTIIGRKGTINNPIYVETKFWNVDTAFGLSPFECLDSKFLYYFCLSYDFTKRDKGTTLPSLVKKDLVNLYMPIPPLETQKRIVEILDEVFEGIEKAIANTKQNLINARELFDSYLNNIFTNKGADWVEKKLGDLCNKIVDGVHHTPKYTEIGIPFLSVKNLTKGFIDFSNTRFISSEDHFKLIKRCHPKINEILLTKVGTTGVAKVIDTDREFSIFVSVALLEIKHDIISNKFLEYFLNSKKGRDQAKKRTTGMANKNLLIKDIKQILILYPKSIDKQNIIVEKFNNLSAETKKLEENYQRKIELLEELKQSILERAFRGELTDNK